MSPNVALSPFSGQYFSHLGCKDRERKEYKTHSDQHKYLHSNTHPELHTHTHVHVRAHARSNTHTQVHTHTQAHTHTHKHTHKHTHTHTHAHTHTHMQAHTHTNTESTNDYWQNKEAIRQLTLPSSLSRQAMKTISVLYSHSILQKSLTVWGMGPCAAM